MISVRAGEFNAFFSVPFEIYGSETHYVSPMRSDLKRLLSAADNPAFEQPDDPAYFTAFDDEKPVGRISVQIQRDHNTRYDSKEAFFGYFDCRDDQHVADQLLNRAERWAIDRGCNKIIGTANLVPTQQMGVQTDGFDKPPYSDQQCNPEHIPGLLTARDYQALFPMTTWEMDLNNLDVSSLLGEKQKALLNSSEFRFAPLHRRDLGARLEEARQLLNAAFDSNPLFTPVSKEAFDYQAAELRWIMERRISAVLHHEGQPAGKVICIPDMNGLLRATDSRLGLSTPCHYLRYRMNRKRAVLIFYAVHPALQGRGVNTLLLHRVVTALQKAGYESLGCTWISDENKASLGQIKKLGAVPLHRLHLYQRDLESIRT